MTELMGDPEEGIDYTAALTETDIQILKMAARSGVGYEVDFSAYYLDDEGDE